MNLLGGFLTCPDPNGVCSGWVFFQVRFEFVKLKPTSCRIEFEFSVFIPLIPLK